MNLIRKRNEIKLDVMIDGYVGFLSVTRNGRPRTHSEYADVMRKLMAHYNEVSAVKINRRTPMSSGTLSVPNVSLPIWM